MDSAMMTGLGVKQVSASWCQTPVFAVDAEVASEFERMWEIIKMSFLQVATILDRVVAATTH